MLYEMAGKPKPGASAAFIDVSNSDAAVWAAETGVVSGNGTGKFLPTQTVTREQAAVMLYNYAKFLGLKTPSSGPSATALLDCGEIAVWARPAVEFCIRTGALSAAGLRGTSSSPGAPSPAERLTAVWPPSRTTSKPTESITAAPADKSAGAAQPVKKSFRQAAGHFETPEKFQNVV